MHYLQFSLMSCFLFFDCPIPVESLSDINSPQSWWEVIYVFWFAERVGAEVVECACVIELPELKVCSLTFSPVHGFHFSLQYWREWMADNLIIGLALVARCWMFLLLSLLFLWIYLLLPSFILEGAAYKQVLCSKEKNIFYWVLVCMLFFSTSIFSFSHPRKPPWGPFGCGATF